jgi:hypothetical protein
MRPDRRPYWLPAPAWVSAFLPEPAVSVRPPSTADFHRRFHPPASFAPPSKCCSLRPALGTPLDLATSRKPKSASLGVRCPHRGVNQRRPHTAGIPLPTFGPSSAFRTPSTVCSATGLAGLFHPAATSRVRPAGVCPSPRSRTGFHRPLPSCRWTKQPAGLTRRQPSRPRLQGLAPRRECGAPPEPVKVPMTRAPPGLLLLRVLSSRAVAAPSRHLRPRPSLR